jgi:hypothetical protein
MVAEILDADLVLSPRPASPHAPILNHRTTWLGDFPRGDGAKTICASRSDGARA